MWTVEDCEGAVVVTDNMVDVSVVAAEVAEIEEAESPLPPLHEENVGDQEVI